MDVEQPQLTTPNWVWIPQAQSTERTPNTGRSGRSSGATIRIKPRRYQSTSTGAKAKVHHTYLSTLLPFTTTV